MCVFMKHSTSMRRIRPRSCSLDSVDSRGSSGSAVDVPWKRQNGNAQVLLSVFVLCSAFFMCVFFPPKPALLVCLLQCPLG